ncbi:MAG: hypothetical protein GC162_19695 [Planctomycetes bacterium]|nr:hypothetical protein [Planctomycetota bacterium]
MHTRQAYRSGLLCAALCLWLGACTALHAAPPPGFDPKRHISVDEVAPGMKGYGMTVFHGVTPEPFAVEVVSVERGFIAGKSVVWIRCPDDRMQLTGPVQGMSGSPIYLWSDDKPDHKLGEGGRMLGAFAFGHRLGKDCYVGVQPIEQMLEAAARTKAKPQEQASAGQEARNANLAAAYSVARSLNLSPQQTWRMDAISKLVGYQPPAADATPAPAANLQHMMLPVEVSTPQMASMLNPFFNQIGLAAEPTAGIPTSALPPKWIDVDKVKLAPGSVFAIPLVSGPTDMAAIGTTTEVLPDGTALAFGHQMFAEGDTDVPMATGFVHYIQPNLSASFKLGGSIKTVGAVLRDETVAVVGKPGAAYPVAPMTVHVRHPAHPELDRDFDYTVVHHSRLFPSLVAAAAGSALETDTTIPMLNTLDVVANIAYRDGQKLDLHQVIPGANAGALATAFVPPIASTIENEFGTMRVDHIDATVTIRPSVEAASILSATVVQSTVKPGETLTVNIRLLPYRGTEMLKQVRIKVPEDTADGQYNLTIGGSQTYQQVRATLRPHLMRADNQAELMQAMQQLLNIRDDALYVVLRLNDTNNVAIGRSELPSLPSSRLALMAVPTSTVTTPFVPSVDVIEPTPFVILNQISLPVSVQEDPTAKP